MAEDRQGNGGPHVEPNSVTGNHPCFILNLSPCNETPVMLPLSMPEPAATDHELILLIRQDQQYTRQQLDRLSTQIAADRGRFEAIALYEQRNDLTLGTLRQDISRAMLEAASAKTVADKAQAELATWQTRFRTLLWVGGPIAIIIGGIAQELIKRLIFP